MSEEVQNSEELQATESTPTEETVEAPSEAGDNDAASDSEEKGEEIL